MHHLQPGLVAEFLFEFRNQVRINLQSDQPFHARKQTLREGAVSRSNLDGDLCGCRASCLRDALQNMSARKEMLPEALTHAFRLASHVDVMERDHQFSGHRLPVGRGRSEGAVENQVAQLHGLRVIQFPRGHEEVRHLSLFVYRNLNE